MTQAQVLSAVRWIIATFGGYFVGRGWVTSSGLEQIGGVIAAILPFVWSMFAHTETATVDAATKVPGVKAVVATPVVADVKLRDNPKVVSKLSDLKEYTPH